MVVLDRINSKEHGLRSIFVAEFRSLFKEVLFEANDIVRFMLDFLSGGNEPSVKTGSVPLRHASCFCIKLLMKLKEN